LILGDRSLTLWAGCVMPFSVDDRIRAAIAGGFIQTTCFTTDFQLWREAGLTPSMVVRRFAEHGVAIRNVDPLVRWLPGATPAPDLGAEEAAISAFSIEEVTEMAQSVGADLITVVDLSSSEVETGRAVAGLVKVCQAAKRVGLEVQLEPMPYSGIRSLRHAWEILTLAGQPNCGLTVDAWHLYRGPSPAENLALLASLPGARILGVQINDAFGVSSMPLRTESMHGRALPGDGALNVRAFLQAMPDPPARALVGPEVFSDQLWRMKPNELGTLLGDRTIAAFKAAGLN
jgi:sugar phosphate isomerase/epimerase